MEAAFEAFSNFIVIDRQAKIVYLNEVYANLLGTRKQDAIGKRVDEVIPNSRLAIVLQTGKEEIGSIMTLFDHTKKKEVTLVCNRIPIKKNGVVVGVLATTTLEDISDVAKLHAEIENIKQENLKYQKKLTAMQQRLHPLEKIIGKSKQILLIKDMILDYADSNLSILVTGETGVGKEVFAKAIHHASNRALSNYVRINCAAIPAPLLESELFGYADGAFTGASKGGKIGKFELADRGTLLLDEICEMPLDLQSKLLRVFQEKEFEKVGSNKTVKFNARIISSTNKDVEEMISKGLFRQDLYYRINIVEIHIPPLRERLEDIGLLCNYFIDNCNKENNTQVTGIEKNVISMFEQYHWPGNVRELEHVVKRAVVIAKTGTLKKKHVSFFEEKLKKCDKAATTSLDDSSLREYTHRAEKEAIQEALKKAGGNKTKAARLLGIDRSRLYIKIKKYGIT